MSNRVRDFVELVKAFEGKDKLGFVERLDLDFKHQVNYEYDRWAEEGTSEEDKVSCYDNVYYQVSVEYVAKRGKYTRSASICTRKHKKAKNCLLELQELLKLEMERKIIYAKIDNQEVKMDNVSGKSLPKLLMDLKKAIAKEDYEEARRIQNEIDKRNEKSKG